MIKKISLASWFLFVVSVHSYSNTLSQVARISVNWPAIASKSLNEEADNHLASNMRSLASREYLTQLNIEQLASDIHALDDPHSQRAFAISVPLPNGELVDFVLTKSRVMESQLAEKFSDITTYDGFAIDQPESTGKFELTSVGFRGMFYYQGQLVYLDPKYLDSKRIYTSYFQRDALSSTGTTLTRHQPKLSTAFYEQLKQARAESPAKAARTPVQLKEYRLAITTTGEYTSFFQGSVSNVMAELATLVNRINMIYEQELAVRMILVANNDQLIFTNAASDPFLNELDNDSDEATRVISNIIGTSNYDIGHVLGTDGGGLAFLGATCINSIKGGGATGSFRPTGDSFYVDLVAHELGHQFGASHTFNGLTQSCGGGNRAANSSYEVGSGSTIMAYAGICGSQNLQSRADPFFHGHSMDQVAAHLARFPSCGVNTAQVNRTPVANAGRDVTIPANTPFTLTGTASDEDGDELTYDWQQFDLGPGSNGPSEQVDDGQRPLFRVFAPQTEPSRTFPRLSDVLTGNLTLGETFATTNRDLNFRLIVRDNKGGVAFDNTVVNVVDTGQAFAVTEPSFNDSWTSAEQIVQWEVANTNQTPISCSAVNISLSVDGGNSFTVELANNAPNNGSFTVNLPAVSSNNARLKVACADNAFFAVNAGRFSVNNSQALPFEITGVNGSLSVDEDQQLTLSVANFTIQGQVADSLVISEGDNYSVDGSTVIPDTNFNGSLSIEVRAVAGSEQTPVFSTQVAVAAVNDAPVATDDELTLAQGANTQQINVLSNDADVDAQDSLTLSRLVYTGDGQASIVNNQISYTPATSFTGEETISYTVSDNSGATDTANLIITVSEIAVNNPPATNNDSITLTQGAGNQLIDVVANDSDPDAGDTLTLTSIDYSGNGQASISNNQISYTPAATFSGQESIGYTVSDSAGLSATGLLNITVNAAPQPPTPAPVEPEPNNSGGSGGGSLYWLMVLLFVAGSFRVVGFYQRGERK
ncbi:Ig-like domain-containing protein [Thalassotalea euphylliae]|nr:Ig-like domain-containing protein [Thalassotalea euphylliae]